eukprot:SAG11_NODE_1934_length_4038_cov_17.421427_6_plen_121_part_00
MDIRKFFKKRSMKPKPSMLKDISNAGCPTTSLRLYTPKKNKKRKRRESGAQEQNAISEQKQPRPSPTADLRSRPVQLWKCKPEKSYDALCTLVQYMPKVKVRAMQLVLASKSDTFDHGTV